MKNSYLKLKEENKELKETLQQFIAILESDYTIGWRLMAYAKEITDYEKK